MLLDLNLRTSSAIFDLVGMFSKPKSVKGILGDATVSRNEKHWFYNCCCLVAKSCLTLWDPMDYSPLGSSVRGISQARILEWVTISSLGDLPDLGIESKLSYCVLTTGGFPDSSVGKESTCSAGDPGLIPGSGRSTGEGIGYPLQYSWASLVAQLVKNLSAMQETWVQALGWKDPLKKGKATHSSVLGWRIPLWSQRVGHD